MTRAFRRVMELFESRHRQAAAPPPTEAAPPRTAKTNPGAGAGTKTTAPLKLNRSYSVPCSAADSIEAGAGTKTTGAPKLNRSYSVPFSAADRTKMIGRAEGRIRLACLASMPSLIQYIKGGGTMDGQVRRTQKGQLVLERKIVELAVQLNQGAKIEDLTPPELNPDMDMIRVATRMEIKIANWLVKRKNWGFEVVVAGHVTEAEFHGLLAEAEQAGLTIYYRGRPH